MADLEAELTGGWDYSELPSNVRLGRGVWIERQASFERFRSRRDPGLVLADDVAVYTWTSFNVEEDAVVEVGPASVLVGAVFMCRERVSIGAGVVISYGVTIADCDFHPVDPHLRRQDAVASAPYNQGTPRPPVPTRPVVIEDGARIGIGAILLKGSIVGRGASVGAGAVVTGHVPPGSTVTGNPARLSHPEAP